MNQSEIREIKRRLKPEGNAIHRIYGTYINGNKEIISSFEQTPGLMPEEEEEMYLKLLKKVLSGTLEKNLMDVEFSVEQVENAPEHQNLMRLKNSSLKDEEAREELVEKIIGNFTLDEKNYLILMALDTYDVSYRDQNEEEVFDGGGEVFSYFLCAICPVKEPKKILKYDHESGSFGSSNTGQIASNPEAGFMFPAFNDRSTDIYHALYYARDPKDMRDELADVLFKSEPIVSAPQQRFLFSDAMETSLKKELSFDVISQVHEKMREAIEVHKEIKDPEPLGISIEDAKGMLKESGVEEERVEAFAQICEETMGESAVLRPQNIIDAKKFEICTSDVNIKISPESSSLIRTEVIDGRKYILVPADGGVTVNGIEISIAEE